MSNRREMFKGGASRLGRTRMDRQEARVEGIRKTQRQQQAMRKRRKMQESEVPVLLAAGAGSTLEIIDALKRLSRKENIPSNEEDDLNALKVIRSWLSLPLELIEPADYIHQSENTVATTLDGVPVFEDPKYGVALTNWLCKLVVQIVLPFMSTYLSTMQNSPQQGVDFTLECLWCIVNIASFDSVATSTTLPLVPTLVALLSSSNQNVQNQAAWAIGNIAGDSVESRAVLQAQPSIVPGLANLLHSSSSNCVRTASFAISNLARGTSTPIMPFIQANVHVAILNKLKPFAAADQLTFGTGSNSVVAELLWVLVYFSAREDAAIEALVNQGSMEVILGILRLVATPSTIDVASPTLVPALRALGNILSIQQPAQCNIVFDPNYHAIQILDVMLSKPTYEISHACTIEAAWCASQLFECLLANVPTHEPRQRLELLLSSGIVTKLSWLLSHSNYGVKGQVAIALYNLARHPDVRAINSIIGETDIAAKSVHSVLSLLNTLDASLIELGLDFVQILIDKLVLQDGTPGTQLVEECGGLETIENLIYSENPPQVCDKAAGIIDTFFGNEEEYEEELNTSNGQFTFDTTFNNNTQHELPSFPHVGNTTTPPVSVGRGKALLKPSWAK